MDLVVGKNHQGFILTITERVSKFFMCTYLPNGKVAKDVTPATINLLLPYKKYVKFITTDKSLEFAEHKKIAQKLDTTVYFTQPFGAWQKGQIENMNKLLRQHILKIIL